jgi:photosystem II stability/assembly factor-like uncharacterized protein
MVIKIVRNLPGIFFLINIYKYIANLIQRWYELLFIIYGEKWVEIKNVNRTWVGVAMSRHGINQTIIANPSSIDYKDSGIWYSGNYGKIWKQSDAPVDKFYTDISINESGLIQVACAKSTNPSLSGNGGIFISMDYGRTWQQIYNVDYNLENINTYNWSSIAISGKHIVHPDRFMPIVASVYGGNLWQSLDFGLNWKKCIIHTNDTETGSLIRKWKSVSISNDGYYATAVAEGDIEKEYGGIWRSSDCGLTWSKTNAPTNVKWVSVSILSSNGKYQSAVGLENNLWVSNDYGQTWNRKLNSTNNYEKMADISISVDSGKYQTFITSDGKIVCSEDNGQTWNYRRDMQRKWSGIAVSCYGYKQTIVSREGDIYVSTYIQ